MDQHIETLQLIGMYEEKTISINSKNDIRFMIQICEEMDLGPNSNAKAS